MFKKSSDLPLFFHRKGIYYGYIVLFAGTLGVIMSIPGQTMGISVYTEYLLKSLKVDSTQLSLAYLCGTMASSFLLPYAGRILDRLGSRLMSGVATFCLALSLIYIANSPSISQIIAANIDINQQWIALAVIFFGFLGVRHFGQGQLTMASRTMMGLWFEKRRGLMLGISGLFVAFGFGLAPLALTKLVNAYHWQSSLYILASVALGMSLFASLFFRRSPEHSGLVIDGGLLSEKSQSAHEESLVMDRNSYNVSEVKRMPTFWIFNLGMVAQAMLITGITFHMAFIAKLNQMEVSKAFSVYLYVAIISTLSDLVGGYFSDRVPLKYLLAVMQSALCIGLIGLCSFGTDLGFAITALGFGISGGLFAQLTGAAWPKLFGRTYLGSIAGLSMSWIVLGSALGPYALSLGAANHASMNNAILLCAIFPFTLVIASFFANAPKKKIASATEL